MIYNQFEVPHMLLLDKNHLLLQTQLPPKPDAAVKPDFHLMVEWQIDSSRQLLGRNPPSHQPARVTFAGIICVEIEFALHLLVPTEMQPHLY